MSAFYLVRCSQVLKTSNQGQWDELGQFGNLHFITVVTAFIKGHEEYTAVL